MCFFSLDELIAEREESLSTFKVKYDLDVKKLRICMKKDEIRRQEVLKKALKGREDYLSNL